MYYQSFSPKQPLLAMVALFFMSFLQGCIKDSCEQTQEYTLYNPVYKSVAEIRQSVKTVAPKNLDGMGKIAYYDRFLLINSPQKGVHIFDNADPRNPVNLAFIEIIGNADIAVANNTLYADSYMDLVAIDISNPAQPILKKRVENVFNRSFPIDVTNGVLVNWERTETTQKIDCSNTNWGKPYFDGGGGGVFFPSNANGSGGGSAPSAVGITGSMSRFCIYDFYLYTVDLTNLRVFDINDSSSPALLSTNNIGWNIETIIPHKNRLLVGSASGMFIFDNSNPANPVQMSRFEHARACDPVFATDNRAYVTLRDGNDCTGYVNQLDVIDITDLSNPSLIRTYPMKHPHGLSVNEKNELYLCEGQGGLKIFDVTDDQTIDQHLLKHIDGFDAFDVITLPNLAMVIGKNGLMQYDITDPSNPIKLSEIKN